MGTESVWDRDVEDLNSAPRRPRTEPVAKGGAKPAAPAAKPQPVSKSGAPANPPTLTLTTGAVDCRTAVAKAAGVAYDQVCSALCAALEAKFPATAEDAALGWRRNGPWVSDVFDDAVVYNWKGSLYRAPYTFAGGVATLTGEGVPVLRAYNDAGASGAAPAGPDAGGAPGSSDTTGQAPAEMAQKAVASFDAALSKGRAFLAGLSPAQKKSPSPNA